MGFKVGRKRIPEEEVMKTICVNVKQKVLTEIGKIGEPKKVIEEILNQQFLEKKE